MNTHNENVTMEERLSPQQSVTMKQKIDACPEQKPFKHVNTLYGLEEFYFVDDEQYRVLLNKDMSFSGIIFKGDYLGKIVCAANRNNDGKIVCGVRHFDSLMFAVMNSMGEDDWLNDIEQGFVDSKGNFLSREHAWIVATKHNQIVRQVGGDHRKLFSENLY